MDCFATSTSSKKMVSSSPIPESDVNNNGNESALGSFPLIPKPNALFDFQFQKNIVRPSVSSSLSSSDEPSTRSCSTSTQASLDATTTAAPTPTTEESTNCSFFPRGPSLLLQNLLLNNKAEEDEDQLVSFDLPLSPQPPTPPNHEAQSFLLNRPPSSSHLDASVLSHQKSSSLGFSSQDLTSLLLRAPLSAFKPAAPAHTSTNSSQSPRIPRANLFQTTVEMPRSSLQATLLAPLPKPSSHFANYCSDSVSSCLQFNNNNNHNNNNIDHHCHSECLQNGDEDDFEEVDLVPASSSSSTFSSNFNLSNSNLNPYTDLDLDAVVSDPIENEEWSNPTQYKLYALDIRRQYRRATRPYQPTPEVLARLPRQRLF